MMERVDLQGTDKSVGLTDVKRIVIDRGEKGEVIITNRAGKMSIYGEGRVLYSEESRRVTRGREAATDGDSHRSPVGTGVCIGDD